MISKEEPGTGCTSWGRQYEVMAGPPANTTQGKKPSVQQFRSLPPGTRMNIWSSPAWQWWFSPRQREGACSNDTLPTACLSSYFLEKMSSSEGKQEAGISNYLLQR